MALPAPEVYTVKTPPDRVDLRLTRYRGGINWLCANNDPKLYRRHLVPNYGHIDGFMGFRANQEVYSVFLEQLGNCPA